MQRWPDRRIVDLLGIEIPIIQAPMAGADSVALAQAVSSAGGLGSLACALLTPDEVQEAARALRDGMAKSFNLNFLSHFGRSRYGGNRKMEEIPPSALRALGTRHRCRSVDPLTDAVWC